MSWGEAGGWVAAVVASITAVFVYGRLTEKVRNLGGWVKALSGRVDDHERRISHLEGRDGVTR